MDCLFASTSAEGNAGGALRAAGLALEGEAGDMGMGDDTQVRPLAGIFQIGLLGREAHAVFLRYLIIAEAVLAGAVIVGIVRVAAALCRLDQQVQRLVPVAQPADIERATLGVELVVVTGEFAMFGAAEIGQHIAEAPAQIATLCPAVIIGRLAAYIEHGVDRG